MRWIQVISISLTHTPRLQQNSVVLCVYEDSNIATDVLFGKAASGDRQMKRSHCARSSLWTLHPLFRALFTQKPVGSAPLESAEGKEVFGERLRVFISAFWIIIQAFFMGL